MGKKHRVGSQHEVLEGGMVFGQKGDRRYDQLDVFSASEKKTKRASLGTCCLRADGLTRKPVPDLEHLGPPTYNAL